MEPLIPLINRLQDVFTAVGSSPIHLPQLVVVGSQSSGKSSVLEHIVGRDFLPRGQGIVTRRPLILQLVSTRDDEDDEDDEDEDDDDDEDGASEEDDNDSDDIVDKRRHPYHSRPAPLTPPNKSKHAANATSPSASASSAAEYGEFLHKPSHRFYSFADIRSEIEAETVRLTGSNKAISSHPISLTIHSPRVLDLTLVDLPGVTKVAVGDQPSDIERVIEDMVLSYIAQPHSLIIAVTPANSDLANSDALKLARQVDPDGRRTLGVLTKVDLMDKGTDCTAVLQGGVYPLAHGFVGVVCRSQHDIHTGKSIAAAAKSEKQFFSSHPLYRPIAHRLGTPYLASRLSSLLIQHIQACLPELRGRIAATIAETQAELESYGSPLSALDPHGTSILLPMISSYAQSYCDALEGQLPDVSLSELYGGARISYVFRDVFTATVMRVDPFDRLSDADIRTAIHNASGPRTALFIPEIAFDLLVKKQIQRLLQPALDAVDMVHAELVRTCAQCEQLMGGLSRFPVLRERLMRCVYELLRGRVEPCKAVITNYVACELSYINTSHPDFIGGSAAVASIMERMSSMTAQQPSHRDATQAGKDREKGGGAPAGAQGQAESDRDDRRPNGFDRPAQPAATAAVPQSPLPSGGIPQHTAVDVAGVRPGATGLHVNVHSNGGSPSQSPLPSGRSGLLSMLWGGNGPKGRRDDGAGAEPLHAFASSPSFASPSALAAPSALSHSASLSASAPPPSSSVASASAASPSSRDLIEALVIKSLISSYFLIVQKTVCDFIPKAVMHHIVQYSKTNMQSAVVGELLVKGGQRVGGLEELMREGEDVAEKRRGCEELIGILEKAMDIVNQARDYPAA